MQLEPVGYVPDQNPFLLKLAIGVMLGADFVVQVQELFQRLALGRHDETDNVHEEAGHGVAIQHDSQDLLHRLDLCLVRALLKLSLELLQGGLVGGIVLVDKAVRVVQEGRHVAGKMEIQLRSGDGRSRVEGEQQRRTPAAAVSRSMRS